MRYVIGVGANLGDPERTVAGELVALPDALEAPSHRASDLFATSPVGGPEQPEFVNAVLIVDSPLTPLEVLRVLQEREASAGRERTVRWGPRTLDLDIVDAGGQRSDDATLTLPHPRAHERGFVLIPWLQVDPDAWLVGHGAVGELVANLPGDQQVVPVRGGA